MPESQEKSTAKKRETSQEGRLKLDEKDQMLIGELLATLEKVAEHPDEPTFYLHETMDLVAEELKIPREELQNPDYFKKRTTCQTHRRGLIFTVKPL